MGRLTFLKVCSILLVTLHNVVYITSRTVEFIMLSIKFEHQSSLSLGHSAPLVTSPGERRWSAGWTPCRASAGSVGARE